MATVATSQIFHAGASNFGHHQADQGAHHRGGRGGGAEHYHRRQVEKGAADCASHQRADNVSVDEGRNAAHGRQPAAYLATASGWKSSMPWLPPAIASTRAPDTSFCSARPIAGITSGLLSPQTMSTGIFSAPS